MSRMSPPLVRLATFLRTHPSVPVGPELASDDPALISARLLAGRDPQLNDLVTALIDGKTSFCLFDIEFFGGIFGRGKRREPWNADGQVIADDELCIAKNGAGDLYVWNSTSGAVRCVVHDEGWATRATYADLNEFIVATMDQCLELLTPDDLDEPSAEYLARLGFALEVGDMEDIGDEDVVERLGELGF